MRTDIDGGRRTIIVREPDDGAGCGIGLTDQSMLFGEIADDCERAIFLLRIALAGDADAVPGLARKLLKGADRDVPQGFFAGAGKCNARCVHGTASSSSTSIS